MGQVSKQQAIVTARCALRAAFASKGIELPDQHLNVIAAQVFGESQYGRAVTGYRPIFWGTNNYGAIQAVPQWQKAHAADKGWGYILIGDVHADGTPYVYPYRLCPTQEAAALDYAAFIAPRVNLDMMATPTSYGTALKHLGYFEAPLPLYIQMITSDLGLVNAAAALDLEPEDITCTTGDDYPPNAFDGKHLPERITLFMNQPPAPAPAPSPSPAGGARYIIALDPRATAAAVKVAQLQDASRPWRPGAVYDITLAGMPWQLRCGPGPRHDVTTWKATMLTLEGEYAPATVSVETLPAPAEEDNG